jgi:hypothetical protein
MKTYTLHRQRTGYRHPQMRFHDTGINSKIERNTRRQKHEQDITNLSVAIALALLLVLSLVILPRLLNLIFY